MREHIDGCHKESKSCATYPEHSTAHLNNIANITFNDIMTPQKRKNKREEDSQEDHKIHFFLNQANKSTIVEKQIEPNESKKLNK